MAIIKTNCVCICRTEQAFWFHIIIVSLMFALFSYQTFMLIRPRRSLYLHIKCDQNAKSARQLSKKHLKKTDTILKRGSGRRLIKIIDPSHIGFSSKKTGGDDQRKKWRVINFDLVLLRE